MNSYSGRASAEADSPLHAFRYREWLVPLANWVRRTIAQVRTAGFRTARRTAGVAPDKWFLVVFVILFLAFFVILLVQPSARH